MKRISLHLEISGESTNWNWKLFHRQGNGNSSTAGVLPFPGKITPKQLLGLIRNGNITSRSEFVEYGAALHNAILPSILSELFSNASDGDCLFVVPPQWAQVPFELLHDKKGFFGERFRIGTIIQVIDTCYNRINNNRPLSFAIIADPAGDLPMAYTEGITLRDTLKGCGRNVRMISSASVEKFREIFTGSSVVHYSGHSVFNDSTGICGWKIEKDTVVDVNELLPDSSIEKRPALVFSNSCEAAQASASLSGVAGALMKKGVTQIIGPFTRVNDKEAAECAIEFYHYLLKSRSPSEALYSMKKQHQKSPAALVYRLFGDPCWIFNDSSSSPPVVKDERKPVAQKQLKWVILAAIVIIVLILLFFPFSTSNNILYTP